MSINLCNPLIPAAPLVVVEDSDEDFDSLLEAAHQAGIAQTIWRAASGGDCLALLRGDPLDYLAPLLALPALILMDLNSHGVDGREALVAIKSDPSLKNIPLVVLTTSANPKDVAFCYQAGANAYHVKPVRHEEYLLLLRSLLQYWLLSVMVPAAMVKVV
jgi:two-component system, response regulator